MFPTTIRGRRVADCGRRAGGTLFLHGHERSHLAAGLSTPRTSVLAPATEGSVTQGQRGPSAWGLGAVPGTTAGRQPKRDSTSSWNAIMSK